MLFEIVRIVVDMKVPISIVLVFLVVSTSLNHAQNLNTKERRASGMVPFPRIGRHLAMASFTRADGSAGLVNYPRVGRSGSVASVSSFGPNSIRDLDTDSRILLDRDFDIENIDDFDYNKHYPSEWEESGKRFEELKNDMWLGNSPSGGLNKNEHRHSRRCNQQVDGPWALLFATREMTNLNEQPAHNFVPRLVREVENEAVTTSNIIS